MKNTGLKNVICQVLASAAVVSAGIQAQALSIDWSGNYRLEYTEVDRTSLDSPSLRKSYFLQHLSLSPKIVAADGFNIVGKFEVLPNDFYPDSQAGQTFGRGPSAPAGGPSSTSDSSVAGRQQGTTTLKVTQLYATITQEYGQFVAGRAPLDFGLGISHSAGNGPFDHWYDTEDMLAYKFVIGNFSLMPIVGKVYDYSVAQGREVQDIIWSADYTNPETESSIGIMHQTRTSGTESNDAPTGAFSANTSPPYTKIGRWNTQLVSLYFARGFEDVKFKLEAAFASGPTGIGNTAGEEVKLNGYGVALDVDFPQPTARWHYNLKMGLASGDNPDTTNYEGFHFHRNYDVAFLLFNHPLGRYDVLRTYGQRGTDRLCGGTGTCTGSPYATDEALDDESISNALYVSPKAVYNINDKLDWTNTVTWAQLQTNPLAGTDDSVSKDLGFEWDTGVVYRPHERVQWVNELGLLFPGAAWQGGSRDYGKGFTYGFASKAAISF